MPEVFHIKCPNIVSTENLARKLAMIARIGDVFLLFGTLGMGKSVFARAFIQSLCEAKEVPSPTFTLVQTYQAPLFDIYHFDLYRLKSPEEVWELNVEEAFSGAVSLIEWPEKMGSYLPRDCFKINITSDQNGCRDFCFETTSEEKAKRLKAVLSDGAKQAENVHATTVDIDGAGVLIIGASGQGKSDLALRLIQNKGAVLIADDRTDLKNEDGRLKATCPQNLKGLLEVRGVGIVQMPFKAETQIKLVVEASANKDVERYPKESFFEAQGVTVPKLLIDLHETSAPDKVVVKLKTLLEEKK